MSYILDALRRADSERERGGVPSIHAKPVPDVLADGEEEVAPGGRQPLRWAVGGLSLALVAVLAWQFMGHDAPEPVVALSPAPPPVVSAPAPAPTLPPPVLSVTSPPAPAVAAAQSPVTQPTQSSPQKPAQRTAAKAPVPAASADADTERPVPSMSELPEDIRRELPQLTVGGAMYSDKAANRMLILNGQVFHEGDKVSPNLVLEKIKLKAAVLAYKGHRYGISY